MELDAIAAVAVGGTLLTGGRATVLGTLLGALHHPARPLHAARQRRAGRGGAGRQGGDHRARRLAAAAGTGMTAASTASPSVYSGLGPPGRAGGAGAADPVRLAALRQFPRRLQRPVLPALQLDVRADRARHVLRDHDRRHRPVGRLDRGHGQRRRRPAQPLRPRRRACSAASPPGLAVGTHQRPDRHAAADPALHRHAGDHAGRQRHRRCCSPTTSRSRSPTTRGFTELGQGDFLGFPIPAWIAAVAYRRSARSLLNFTAFGPQRAGDRRRRGRGPADGPAGRPGDVPRSTC